MLLQVRDKSQTQNAALAVPFLPTSRERALCKRRKVTELSSIQRLKGGHSSHLLHGCWFCREREITGFALPLSPFLSALIHSPRRGWHYEDSLRSCLFSSLMQAKFSFFSSQASLYFFGCLPSHFPFFPVTHPLKKTTWIFNHDAYIYVC